jgi:nucleoside phosphorylase
MTMALKTVPPTKYDEYTVGWICALPCELAAARAMLDVEHGVPESRSKSDCNTYFLGSIGLHNVAIACLLLGSAGTTPAATVATDMQRTFSGVCACLLVGVGSGVPSKANDIRLGDVVVSVPVGDTGGAIQYEHRLLDGNGGDTSDGSSGYRFVRTRCLNAPPLALLTALASLQAEHNMMGGKALDFLAEAAQKHPRMKLQFAEPVVGSHCVSIATSSSSGSSISHVGDGEVGKVDQLYQASYEHVAAGGTLCGHCDARMLLQQPERQFNGPTAHYGLIALGNLEFNSSIARDQAKMALGAICFEREVAGLMNSFPCLVIWGICDYADLYRSASWYGYAAASAAAFAKELLGMMLPREVENMATMVEAMHECTKLILILSM